jgi:hypothetical protein
VRHEAGAAQGLAAEVVAQDGRREGVGMRGQQRARERLGVAQCGVEVDEAVDGRGRAVDDAVDRLRAAALPEGQRSQLAREAVLLR